MFYDFIYLAKGFRMRPKVRSTLKQSTRNLCLNYTETEKRRRALGQDLFYVIGLFETLICAIAKDKFCDSCIVSSWALLIFLRCLWWLNSNFLCCMITQTGESSRDLLLSVTNRKALAPGSHNPPEPPLKHNNITTSHFLTTRPAAGCWLGEKVSTW